LRAAKEELVKNREVYESALRLLAEPDDSGRLEDFELRAPYVLGGFFYENGRLESEYRKYLGLDTREFVHAVFADLDDDFPFAERFVPAAEYYLASMLVIDEDGELSDKFFDLYSSSMSNIVGELPGSIERIADVY
jgi:hypothetical protein